MKNKLSEDLYTKIIDEMKKYTLLSLKKEEVDNLLKNTKILKKILKQKDFSDNDRINFMDLLAKKFTGREWPDMTEGPIVAENFKNAFYFNARKEGYML